MLFQSSVTGSQPLNEDQQPKYVYKRTSSGGRTLDAIDSYSTSDVVKAKSNYSNISRQGSPTKIIASNANLSYAPPQTPNTMRRIPQYAADQNGAPKSRIPLSFRPNNHVKEDEVKVAKKAPAMSTHQTYFNQYVFKEHTTYIRIVISIFY